MKTNFRKRTLEVDVFMEAHLCHWRLDDFSLKKKYVRRKHLYFPRDFFVAHTDNKSADVCEGNRLRYFHHC